VRRFERRLGQLEATLHFDPSGHNPSSEAWQIQCVYRGNATSLHEVGEPICAEYANRKDAGERIADSARSPNGKPGETPIPKPPNEARHSTGFLI
jgi:hypothetical protein